ncbi:MAG: FtsX-like permease family protein [Anaerolineae bacterium]|nr:FtsX-like permease family protein [Anaerolineae bacterium]
MSLNKLLWFAIVHSWRDLWRNRSRTVFALVCVATGVAAVVALRSLAFMVGDELTTNLAQLNRGDIRVYASRNVPELVQLSDQQRIPIFNQETVDAIRAWADREEVDVTMARVNGGFSLSPIVNGDATTARPIIALYVEPGEYPYYDTLALRQPAGAGLEEVFVGPDDREFRPVVISNNLARQAGLGLRVGDMVRLGAFDPLYYVAGIARAESETVLTNPAAAFFGDYVYLPMSDSEFQGEDPLPDQVFIRVPLGRDIGEVEKSLVEMLQQELGSETDIDEELNRATVPELEEQNAEVAGVIDDLILVLGLSSLLIGGIGIINTMLVVVSRRTLEIAVMKTLGLKGYRVTLIFLVEALLLGVIGSLIGVVIGVILSYLIRGVGEEAFSLSLEWRLYPAAMFSGLFLGVVMTGLFGFMPTLIAGQVRPAIVLRPNEAQMPAAGLLQTLVTLVVMIVILGVLVSAIVEGAIDYGPVYMIVGGGALVGLFAGVIIANTRLGQPMPEYYKFRLVRRFERLDGTITGAAGLLLAGILPVPAWRGLDRGERGRTVITGGLRTLRQAILLYGSLAIGAAAASGIMLVVSEIWLPFGIGDSKPANDVIGALDRGDTAYVVAWALLALLIGAAIRWWARALVGVIALASLGVTVGAGIGFILGLIMESLIADTAAWNFLAEMSTGVVLVEGALALLCVVYVLYWLLVWAVGKLPPGVLMGIVSLTLLSLMVGAAAVVVLVGVWALVLLTMVALVVWWVARRGRWPGTVTPTHNGDLADMAQTATRGTSAVMLAVAAVAGGFWIMEATGSTAWWGGALVGAVVYMGLWVYLRRNYRVDGRLILREMAGRKARVASTLLGLSVGIAGLSIVSLTTGATSHLLEFQLTETAEGNLLIGDPTSTHKEEVRAALDGLEGVESYSQVTMYLSVLLTVNGEEVRFSRMRNDDGSDPHENSNLDRRESGVSLGLTVREDLDNMPDYNMIAGRAFGPDDAGQHRIMLRESFVTERFDIGVGDRLMFLFENDPGEADDVLIQFRVSGIISRNSEQTGLEELGQLSMIPPGVLPETVRSEGTATIVMVDESDDAYMDQVLVAVSRVPGVIAFELGALTQLVQNLIDQLKAIPTLVAWLALVAGTAIIANTVALATQERRRQIGVMKAVGLKGRRVLAMLIIENGLIGLIAGLIGNGVGFLITVILVLTSRNPDELQNTIEFDTMGWLILMSIGVAIGAATLSAWSAAAEKPMNVLRYE